MGCCLCRESWDGHYVHLPASFVEDELDSEAVGERIAKAHSDINNLGNAVEEFVSAYLQWEKTRRKACEDVIEIANQIDKHHKNVNKAKITGGAVGAVASALAAGGAIASPFMFGAGLLVAIPAGAVAGAAFFTTGGAMIIDKFIQYKLQKKALEHLLEDKERTERMAECLQKVHDASEEVKNAVQGIAESVKDISGRIGFSSIPVFDQLEDIKPFLEKLATFAVSNILTFSGALLKIVGKWATVIKACSLVKGVLSLSTLGITLANGVIVVVFTAMCVFQVITLITALVDYHKGSLTEAAANLRSYVESLEQDRAKLEALMNAHYSHLLHELRKLNKLD